MTAVEVYLKDYTRVVPGTAGDPADPVYRLRVTYQALSYFALINSFQFTLPIYVLLFTFVSIVLMLSVVVFWLANLQFSTFKRPPNLRFSHLARVTFLPPATGAALAAVPSMIVAALLSMLQGASLFADVSARWTDFGDEVGPAAAIAQARGRLGVAFVIISIVFLLHGAQNITT